MVGIQPLVSESSQTTCKTSVLNKKIPCSPKCKCGKIKNATARKVEPPHKKQTKHSRYEQSNEHLRVLFNLNINPELEEWKRWEKGDEQQNKTQYRFISVNIRGILNTTSETGLNNKTDFNATTRLGG
jgi:hypothetical protein